MSKNIDFTSCIIVAYGSGKRFSNSLNKLLVPLKGIPIFEHSLIKFNSNNKICFAVRTLFFPAHEYESHNR